MELTRSSIEGTWCELKQNRNAIAGSSSFLSLKVALNAAFRCDIGDLTEH